MTQSGHRRIAKRYWIKFTNSQFVDLQLLLDNNNDKAKPAKRRGRKATGLRFLREAMEDLPKDAKIAELPKAITGY